MEGTLWLCMNLLCLAHTVITQEAHSEEEAGSGIGDDFLLFTETLHGRIYQMSLSGLKHREIPVGSESKPASLDYDPESGAIYWYNQNTHTIEQTDLSGQNINTVLELPQSSDVLALAVDPVNNLLFYSDASKASICLIDLNTRAHKTILLNVPDAKVIRLDPQYRFIYWNDWTAQTIEKANYDGSDRNPKPVISVPGNAMLNGFTIDLQDRMLFWSDAENNTISRAGLDGTNVEVLVKYTPVVSTITHDDNTTSTLTSEAHFSGVAVDEQFLYFTDWYNRSILRAGKYDGSGLTHIGPKIFDIVDSLIIYKSNTYVKGQPSDCIDKNGDCSDFCIPLSTEYVCACPDDRRITEDGYTCTETVQANGPDVVWLEYDGLLTGYIRGIKGEPAHYLDTFKVNTWSIKSPAWHWTAVDTNYQHSALYLIDSLDKFLVKMNLNGTKQIQVIYYGMSSEANGVAYDWVAGNLYWTDGLYNWIMVAKAEEKTQKVKTLIRTGLDKPHGIVVYPQEGLLFWSDWGPSDKIEVANLAGDERRTLVEENLKDPTGLTMDYISERLFWVNRDSIESINIDGSGRSKYEDYPGSFFLDLAFHNNYLFATDRGSTGSSRQLWFFNLEDSSKKGVKLGLPRAPYGVTMYHKDRQPPIPSGCSSLACEQMCVTAKGNSSLCLCQDGYTLNTDQRTCQESDRYLGSGYVYSMGDRICLVSTKDATSSLISSPSICFFSNPPRYEFHALDFHYGMGDIYFSEVRFSVKSIRRASLKDRTDNNQIIFGTGNVEGIAIDWIANNLYWSDATYRQIWVSRLDGTYQKTLLKTPDVPTHMAVDPINRYLYWVEGSKATSYFIKRSSLSATDIIDFVNPDLLNEPSGLTLDLKNLRLFWVDKKTRKVESVDFTGEQHKTQNFISGDHYFPLDVAVLQDYMIITDRNPTTNQSGLRIIERQTGREVHDGILHQGGRKLAYDVIAYDEHNQPDHTNGCVDNNGGCEQLCFPSRGLVDHICACIEGMILADNSKMCIPAVVRKDEFFLVADDYKHSIYQTDTEFNKITALKFPAYDRPIGMAYDHTEERLYWSDFTNSQIRRAFLNGTELQTIVQYKNATHARVDGIAFDPISRLLYYTDLGRKMIGVTNPTGQYHKALIVDDLLKPRALVLNPDEGQFYFTQQYKIMRADMDGANVKVIIENLGWPSGLTIDFIERKLYWCDHNTELIQAASLDDPTQAPETLMRLEEDANPFGITHYNGYLYWTDWSLRGISRTKTDGSDQKMTKVHEEYFTGLNEIIYFNKANTPKSNACSVNNGGCSHFCLPQPSSRTCACPDDENGPVFPVDKINCPSTGACPESIPNGHLSADCTRRVGETCQFTCNPSFGSVTLAPITCQPGLTWNIDHLTLCKDVSCPLLETPDNAYKDIHCPHVAGAGATCWHTCDENYIQNGGNARRDCVKNSNGLAADWTGDPLICKEREREYACPPLSPPANAMAIPGECGLEPQPIGAYCVHVCDPGHMRAPSVGNKTRICTNDTSWTGQDIECEPVDIPVVGPNKNQDGVDVNKPMLMGVIIAALVILVAIIALSVILCRRRKFKRRYEEQSNISTNETEIPSRELPPPGDQTLVYDATNQTVKMDGSVAFDNPGYMTHQDVKDITKSHNPPEMGPLPAKPPLDGAVSFALPNNNKKGPDAHNAFENPMFGKNSKDQYEDHYESLPSQTDT